MRHPLDRGIRGSDRWGSGGFGAGRGDRKHAGVDYICKPGDVVVSPITGKVKRWGYCYSDPQWMSYRLVEIASDAMVVRLLYMLPSVAVGNHVNEGDPLGIAQNIAARYPGMIPHVHVDLRPISGSGALREKDGLPLAGRIYLNPAVMFD